MAPKPRVFPDKPKVFGIGFQKTGTTSLGKIFDDLGFKNASYHEFRHFAPRESVSWEEITELALELAENIQVAKDTPWPLLYKELDAKFPGSKFIHVTRDPERWIDSAVNDFEDNPNAIHTAIYGCPYPKGYEEIWLDRYNQHNADVAEYFKDRPDDYLHLKLEDGVTYEAVCDFLGEPRIKQGAPVTNTRFRKRLMKMWWSIRGHG